VTPVFFDLVALLAALVAFALIFFKGTGRIGNGIAGVLLLFITLGAIRNISNILEWSTITETLDPYEDYLEILIPVLWAVMLVLVHQRSARKENEITRNNLDSFFNSVDDMLFVISRDGTILAYNNAVCTTLGYDETELNGMSLVQVHPPHCREDAVAIVKEIMEHKTNTCPLPLATKNGRMVPVETKTVFGRWDGVEVLFGIARDLSLRKELEARLRESEKMMAIGQLAGGVAHDFNNQLAGISGYADLLNMELEESNPRCVSYVKEIKGAVKKSADLTAKMLAFASKGKYQSAPVDLHACITDTIAVIRNTLQKRVTILQHLTAQPSWTTGDPSQLHNALLNCALNACDAVDEGGTISFSTRIHTLTQSDCLRMPFDIVAGPVCAIDISDNGCGIEPETINRVFEPFFTTKETGKGTGMGLAAVYGTVKSHRGAVTVESTPGKGSTFTLFFPLYTPQESPLHEAETSPLPRGTGTILVIDDQPTIRSMAQTILGKAGFTVLTAKNGSVGIDLVKQHGRELRCVILDLVMPVMDGRETFFALQDISPDTPVFISSGYSIDGAAQELLNSGAAGFLQKPFSITEVIEKVNSVCGEHS